MTNISDLKTKNINGVEYVYMCGWQGYGDYSYKMAEEKLKDLLAAGIIGKIMEEDGFTKVYARKSVVKVKLAQYKKLHVAFGQRWL